jgi:hypothetical protein
MSCDCVWPEPDGGVCRTCGLATSAPTRAVVDGRLRDEPWLLRDPSTLLEAFPSGPEPGRHRCKLCEEFVALRDGGRHLAAHLRRRDRNRARGEAARVGAAAARLARYRQTRLAEE